MVASIQGIIFWAKIGPSYQLIQLKADPVKL